MHWIENSRHFCEKRTYSGHFLFVGFSESVRAVGSGGKQSSDCANDLYRIAAKVRQAVSKREPKF